MSPVLKLDGVLERTPFKDFEDKTILLTGGTGFFGTWIREAWIHARREGFRRLKPLCILSRREQTPQEGIEWLRGDVRDFKLLNPVDWIIHAATPASADLDQNHPDEMKSIIVEGARNIARQRGTARVLFTSSGAVYGPQPADCDKIPEDFIWRDDPRLSAYAYGKREAEAILKDAVIARCFAFVGPGLPLNQHFAIGNFMADGLAGRKIHVKGDGSPLRSYLYAGDLVAWLFTLLAKGKKGEAYNVGSDQAISIAELAGLVARLTGSSVEIESKPGTDLRNRYIPSIEKARSQLGLQVYTSLEDSILRTLEYLR